MPYGASLGMRVLHHRHTHGYTTTGTYTGTSTCTTATGHWHFPDTVTFGLFLGLLPGRMRYQRVLHCQARCHCLWTPSMARFWHHTVYDHSLPGLPLGFTGFPGPEPACFAHLNGPIWPLLPPFYCQIWPKRDPNEAQKTSKSVKTTRMS